jgi:outer membrane protein assembly factor BamA
VIGVRRVSAGLRAAGRLSFFLLFIFVSVLLSTGCTSVPAGRSAVKSVELTGNDALDADDLREKLATTSSPKFLGLFQGVVYDYSVFDRFVLERDLQRIERYYRARGYYQARARAGRVFFVEPNKVRVDIQIEEGEKMLVGRVDVHGLEALKEPWVQQIVQKLQFQLCGKGRCQGKPSKRPFEEDRFVKAAEALQRELENHGYAYATVQRAADVDLPKNLVAVGYFAKPGPKALFGPVTIVGLGKVPEDPVRRAVDLKEKDPYSRADLDLAERALLDLNVFSSVVITPELDPNGASQAEPIIPIKVTVEPAKLKAIHVGGGAQVDSIQSDVHLVGGWEHRNLFGGLRSLTFELKPGVVLYPTRFPTFKAPTNYLPEGRFNAAFRQPGFLEARTGFFTRLDGTIAPVILSPDDTSGNVLGYRDIRISTGLDRSFNSLRLFGSISPTVQFDSPFAYLGDKNKYLTSVVITYPEVVLTLDLRDDQVHPHEGLYVTTDQQFGLPPGGASDVKTTTEVRGYLPIPGMKKKWTLAARVRVGLLFPQNYGGTIEDTANQPPPAPCPVGPTGMPTDAACEDAQRHRVKDTQLMFLRGYFAGGLGSNRGYALREIGPHGVVQQGSSTLAKCASGASSTESCDLPLGGFTLWEASIEVRYPIAGALSGAVFTDTADVSDKQMSFRLNRPHLSVGFGVRYETPVGPIRLDAGYRVPGLQAPAGAPDEGIPSKTFGVPMALSFGIGEAF